MKKQQTVLCSLKDEKGNLWFGNSDGSLTCYYKKERSFKILRLITEDGDLNKSSVWALFLDSKGRFGLVHIKDFGYSTVKRTGVRRYISKYPDYRTCLLFIFVLWLKPTIIRFGWALRIMVYVK